MHDESLGINFVFPSLLYEMTFFVYFSVEPLLKILFNSMYRNAEFSIFVFESLLIFYPPFSSLCRECEGCTGEEGEAVAEEESQTGDQRRQDREQSLGESTHAALKLILY